uniref:Rab3 GTPase-activating protein catalytic subunit n=1 Tax=Rhabditophanes sp. KR3021 TaxID=114890 RepID=A0AC35U3N6_9BILA
MDIFEGEIKNFETKQHETNDEDEIFEINDFTTVTDLEQFSASIEVVLRNWSLNGIDAEGAILKNTMQFKPNFLNNCKWAIKSETIKYRNKHLVLSHHYLDDINELLVEECDRDTSIDTKFGHLSIVTKFLNDSSLDFCKSSVITNRFGVLEWLLITPVATVDTILNVDELKLLVSGLHCAMEQSECILPIFIQFKDATKSLYDGFSENYCIRNEYNSAYLLEAPTHLKYAKGIIDMFIEKCRCPLLSHPSVEMGIRFDYSLEEEVPYTEYGQEFKDSPNAIEFLSNNYSAFPILKENEAISEFKLIVSWPILNERLVNEEFRFSDLEPLTAPKWYLEMIFKEGLTGYTYNSLRRLLKTITNESEDIILLDMYKQCLQDVDEHPINKSEPFSKLTENYSDKYKNFVSASNFRVFSESFAFEEKECEELLNVIFSSVHEAPNSPTSKEERLESDLNNLTFESSYKSFNYQCQQLLRRTKSVYSNSLCEYMATLITHCLSLPEKNIVAVSQIWICFVKQLRHYFENGIYLPGFELGITPSFADTLLQQKLQMLQCCIEAKNNWTKPVVVQNTVNDSNTDEFFDAEEEFNEDETQTETKDEEKTEKLDTKLGRLHKMKTGICLFNNPDQIMYVPLTQNNAPLTEDQFEDQMNMITSNGGEDKLHSQIDVLKSDMQAFKAANPECSIEDFVRWHSPSDWLQTEDGIGKLSDRMTGESNLWQLTWNNCKPIPVSQQPRLFNDTKEALKILDSFERISLKELSAYILPVAFTSAINSIVISSENAYDAIEEDVFKMCRSLTKITYQKELDTYFDILREIMLVENVLLRFKTIENHFNECKVKLNGNEREELNKIIKKAVQKSKYQLDVNKHEFAGETVRIIDAPRGAIASAVYEIMSKDYRVNENVKFPPPAQKQYVVRSSMPRPGRGSRLSHNRLYVNINESGARYCGSFSEDYTIL